MTIQFLARQIIRRNGFFAGMLIVALCIGILLPTTPTSASSFGSLQATLLRADGTPITAPVVVRVGAYALVGRAVTTSTLQAAPLLWQEVYDGSTQNCPLVTPDSQGTVSIAVGSCSPIPNTSKYSSVVFGLKVGTEPGRPSLYDISVDEKDVGTANAVWVHKKFISLQNLRKSPRFTANIEESGGGEAAVVTVEPALLAANPSSSPRVDTAVVTSQSVENMLGMVSSTFIQMSASSTLDLLQKTEIPDFSVSRLEVAQSLMVQGSLTVEKAVAFGVDTVGQAEIVEGGHGVSVVFSSPYPRAPIVVITPSDYDGLWKMQAVSSTGFTISVPSSSLQNIIFNWHAFLPTSSMKITVGERDSTENTSVKVLEAVVPADEVRVATSTQDGGETGSIPASSTVPVEPIDHTTTTETVDGATENITTTQENFPVPHDITNVVSSAVPSAAEVGPITAPATEVVLPPSIITE